MSAGIAVTVVAFVLAAGVASTVAVSRHYRVPQVPHLRTPEAEGIAFEERRFATAGGKQLYGWWIPAQAGNTAPAVILVHGWGRNLERMMPYVRSLHREGFHLFAFDARCHGSSDPDGHGTMVKFSEDIRAAVDLAVERSEVDRQRLAVLGLSVGGAAAIHAAARDPRIRGVVTVGAFAHPGDAMAWELSRRRVPGLLIRMILRWVEWRVGFRLDEVAPERQIARVSAPVLLVHGEADEVVPLEQARRLEAAAGRAARLLVLPGRGHSDCDRDPRFWPEVLTLLRR